MIESGRRCTGGAVAHDRPRWLVAILLAAMLAAGCDHPFDPFEEDAAGPFSIFGYLDVNADVQWIRVMPIRQNLLAEPAPIDAVVTLEHLGSGRVVTLRDSLFGFADPRLGGVGYVHNFWTTERLEPEATYRLTAVRSDGAATTALIEMPPELVLTLLFWEIPEVPGVWEPRQLFVEGEHHLYTDILYTVWDTGVEPERPGEPVAVRQMPLITDPGRWGFAVPGTGPFQTLDMPPFTDKLRREAQIAVAGSDWPYGPGLPATDIVIPGNIPTTVENGVGFVAGVATWTIPLPLCLPLEARPDVNDSCATVFDGRSASIAGSVTGDPCGAPAHLPTVRLTERYPGGGAVVWEWKTDWDGAYRFDGIEPGSDLLLEFGDPPDGAIQLRALGPGERYIAPHVTIPSSC
jgi:hypothetical protein